MSHPRLEGPSQRLGKLWLVHPDTGEEVAVTVRYLRPLSARTEIVFLDEKHREVVTVPGIEALTGEGRARVERALRERYHMAVVARVERIDVQFGTRYWKVDTDRGRRWFALKEPGKNVTWLSEDHLVVRDTAGNRYEIPSVAALDGKSRRWIRQAL